jgi:hypothetical protein
MVHYHEVGKQTAVCTCQEGQLKNHRNHPYVVCEVFRNVIKNMS